MSNQEQQTMPDGGASVSTAGLGAWLPIETAPRDGTLILGATRNGSVYAVAYDDIFSAPWRVVNDFGLNAGALTHWMPAPKTPNARNPVPAPHEEPDAK